MADSLWNRFWNGDKDNSKDFMNLFNKVFYQFIGGQEVNHKYNSDTYLKKAYAQNPDVFAIMDQRMRKVRSIPYYIKKVKDQKSYKLLHLKYKFGYEGFKSFVDKKELETKAYDEVDLPFPKDLDRPNPLQSWSDLFALDELYYGLLGNTFYLKIAPTDGPNKGVAKMVYVLPTQKVRLVLKQNAYDLFDENPIDYYLLTDGDQSIRFESENIIHIKTANPFFDLNGTQLYGFSPLEALMLNIESSNASIKNNLKMINNSGVFGLISGKDAVLTPDQATQIKQKLFDMDKDAGRLSRIAGMSVPVEFTRLSLSADEMKPFDYLDFDRKTICNVLGWPEVLLNSEKSATWNNLKTYMRIAISNTIKPNLVVRQEALTTGLIQFFKGYEDAILQFDETDLPEMQEDMTELVKWMNDAYYTPNEIRIATKGQSLDIDGMDIPRDKNGNRIDDISITESDVQKAYKNYIEED